MLSVTLIKDLCVPVVYVCMLYRKRQRCSENLSGFLYVRGVWEGDNDIVSKPSRLPCYLNGTRMEDVYTRLHLCAT